MLSILLDENISDEVSRQVLSKHPTISIASVYDWNNGSLKGASDETILRTISNHKLTLLTYDVNTIPILLVRLANEGFKHAGVVFVNNLTIRSDDIGGLMNAIVKLYTDEGKADWEDRAYFLRG